MLKRGKNDVGMLKRWWSRGGTDGGCQKWQRWWSPDMIVAGDGEDGGQRSPVVRSGEDGGRMFICP